MKLMHGRTELFCPYCPFVAPSEEVLHSHKCSTHRDLDCPYCGKLLATWWAHERHVKKFHSDELPEKMKQEELAREASSRLSETLEQKRRGQKKKVQECNVCKKVFNSRPALTYHTAIHHSEVVYACDHCNAVFPHPMLLKSHILRHGEKTVMCHRCGRKFFTQKQLNSHENLFHRRARSYSCKLCKVQFSTQRSLKHHMKTKPHGKFQCQECDIYFVQKQEYFSHIVSHGPRCILCKISFNSPIAAHKHYRSVHGATRSIRKCVPLKQITNENAKITESLSVELSPVKDVTTTEWVFENGSNCDFKDSTKLGSIKVQNNDYCSPFSETVEAIEVDVDFMDANEEQVIVIKEENGQISNFVENPL